MFLGLRTAIDPAPDLAAARDWYARVLALEPCFDEPFYVGSVAGFELGIVPGATALDPVTDVGDRIRTGAVLDPFGNRLGFIENRHFDRAAVR